MQHSHTLNEPIYFPALLPCLASQSHDNYDSGRKKGLEVAPRYSRLHKGVKTRFCDLFVMDK
jgi:hypothetical protein